MEHEDDHVDLRGALAVLRSRWRIVLAAVACVLALAIGWSLTQTPQYDATVVMLAGQNEGIADLEAVSAVNQAIASLARMAVKPIVVEGALQKLGEEDVSANELSSRITAQVPTNTQTIELTLRDSDPDRAARHANAIAESFSNLIAEKTGKDSTLSATIWQPATPPTAAATPNIPRNAAIGLVLGLLLGTALAFLRNQLDLGWRNERDVEAALGVPTLAAIPTIGSRTARQRRYA